MVNARFAAAYAVLLAAILYLGLHRDLGVPMKRRFESFPAVVSGWRMSSETTLSSKVEEVLKASDVLYREYVNGSGDRVELYVGYHDGGKGSGEIHSPKHCLPGSGWFEIYSRPQELAAAGERLKLVRALYQKGDRKELFLYWYQVGDASISNEYALKLAEIVNSVLHRRRDASFIRVSVPVGGGERQAEAVGEAFVRDFFPTIRQYLPG